MEIDKEDKLKSLVLVVDETGFIRKLGLLTWKEEFKVAGDF